MGGHSGPPMSDIMVAMRRAIVLALLVAAGISLAPGPLFAQIYRWVDDAGVPHYAEGIDSVPERFRARVTPLGLRTRPPASDPVPAQGAAARSATIRYAPGRPIMADVLINGSTSARLLVDTGADRTMISPRALAAAGVSLSRSVARGRLVGVAGSDEVPYVLVDSLEVAGLRVGRMPVAAYELTGMDADGLLGRDVLEQFHVAIDAAQGLVTLSPK